MFTIPKDSPINKKVITEAVKYNETLIKRYRTLDKLYVGSHEIRNREKPEGKANNKTIINHAEYITDTNVGFLMGNPLEYQVKGGSIDIDPILEEYSKQEIHDFDIELAEDISIFGSQYEYVYADEDSNVISTDIDNEHCVLVYDDTMKHNIMFAILYELNEDKTKKDTFSFKKLKVVDSDSLTEYANKSGNIVKGKATGHFFEEVPVIEHRNNKRKLGDFESVATLINAYNVLMSDRVDDKEDLVNALLAVKGMEITNEQATSIKKNRIISNIPTDGDISYVVKQLNETELSVLRRDIASDIHKISKTPDMTDENFVGNSSGVAISYKLFPFLKNTKKKERYFVKSLKKRLKLYNTYLKKKGKMSKIVPTHEVEIIFKRSLPQNDFETSQMINNLHGLVPTEKLISQLSFVENATEEMEALDQENDEFVKEDSSGFGTDETNE